MRGAASQSLGGPLAPLANDIWAELASPHALPGENDDFHGLLEILSLDHLSSDSESSDLGENDGAYLMSDAANAGGRAHDHHRIDGGADADAPSDPRVQKRCAGKSANVIRKIKSGRGTAKAAKKSKAAPRTSKNSTNNGVVVAVYDPALVAEAAAAVHRVVAARRIQALDFETMEEIFTTDLLKSAIIWCGRPGDDIPSQGNKMFLAFKRAVRSGLVHGKSSWDYQTGSCGKGYRRKVLSRGYAAGTKGRVKSKMAALQAQVDRLSAENGSLRSEVSSLRAQLRA